MDYNQIIKYFSSSALIIGGIIYLAKLIIDKFIESRIEQYKNLLQIKTESFRHDLNFEAEKFKHQLSIKAVEHQIKYSKLYEERGTVIKLIYTSLLNLENSLNDLTTIFQGPEWVIDTKRDNNTEENIQNLREGIEQNRIFFSLALNEKIDLIISESKKIRIEMNRAKSNELRNQNYFIRHNTSINIEKLNEPLATWIALEQKVQIEIKAARLNLAQEFRVLIGVE